ncbi:S8 family serine peptidase [Ascidiaceihabitans sp.]|uniref:S8 family serine peptidase n=1 Tax=Ascidiaceihabitans sp. TaxID=1872644 RepID=UPI003298ADFB
MQLQWKDVSAPDVLDYSTDYRLRQAAMQQGAPAQDQWWSALVQLDNMSLVGFADVLQSSFDGDAVIPVEDLIEGEDESDPDFFVKIFAKPNALKALNATGNSLGVRDINLGHEVSDDAAATASKPDLVEGAANNITVVEDGTVTVGIIDDGIGFAHNLFRKGLTETRLAAMYIMDADNGPNTAVGRKLFTKQINALMVKNTFSGILDEEAFYTAAGSINYASPYFSTTMYRRSHGSHVMSLAAGYPMEDAREDRPIVAAQLPSAVSEDTTGTSLAPSLRSALRFIKRRAKRIRVGSTNGPIAPLVVNFSYGNFNGPSDGTSTIARIIDHEMQSTPEEQRRMVMPAGNSNLARVHAAINFAQAPAGHDITLDLNVMPDDFTGTFVEAWMPYSASTPPPNFVAVRVTPPFGSTSLLVHAQAGSSQVLQNAAGEQIAELAYALEPAPTARGVITLSINPTFTNEDSVHVAPSGRWTMAFQNNCLPDDETVQVRIQRDETLPGYKTGARQAYFNNACYVRFNKIGAPLPVDPEGSDCPIQRAGTLNGFACGDEPIMIGGLTQSNGQLAVYSSAGPSSKARGAAVPTRMGPDASARSDDSLVVYGVLGAGTRSGSMVHQNGTSVAAPLAARMVIDALAEGEDADRAWVAAQGERDDSSYPPLQPAQPFATRTGGGRLRLANPFGPQPPQP